jgi:hypothetical protein
MVNHDPELCGLDDGGPDSICPGCRAEAAERNGRGSESEVRVTATGQCTDSSASDAGAQEKSNINKWPEPPAPEAYYGLAGQIVNEIAPNTEADPAALLVHLLVGTGNIIGRTAHFIVEDTVHFLNEYAVIVGRTSKARKGTSKDRALRLFDGIDDFWLNERIKSGLSSGEGVIWHCRDSIFGQDKSGETVQKDPGEKDKRLLAIEPEYATVLRQVERQGNTLSVILRQGWDGSTLSSLTSGRQHAPIKATGAHVSIIGHITVEEYRRLLTDTEAASGYGNRFLNVCVKRSNILPRGGKKIDLSRFTEKLGKVVGHARQVGRLTWDDEAGEAWDAVYPSLSEGKPGLTGALLARAEAHVMRLSCIYAVLGMASKIGINHLKAALALWEYSERSTKYIFEDSTGDAVADEILRLLRAAGADGLTRTEINDCFRRNVTSSRIGQALGVLLENKLARFERVQTKEAGRPTERWFAVQVKG